MNAEIKALEAELLHRNRPRTLAMDEGFDADLPGVKHDPSNGQFATGGGTSSAASSEKKAISKKDLKTKLSSVPYEKLNAAYAHKDTDPAVKEMIGKELDERANRGSNKGLGEIGHKV